MNTKKESQDSSFAEKEFVFTEADFNDITNRIYKLAGIVLQDHKKDMVYGRLARRIRALNFKKFSDYRDYLDSSQGKPELQNFVNALTTNLTSFFREEHHFTHFKQEIKSLMQADPRRRLRVWCSAASTGQEPYSIAMSLDQVNVSAAAQDVKVLCTDLDTNVLAKCQDGIYDESHLEKMPHNLQKLYFKPLDSGRYEVTRKLKDLLIFKQLNLLSNWPMRGPFDAIFCRNVLIYFDFETRMAIISKMMNILRPKGVLYLGHSEAFPLEHDLVKTEGHTIFRKI
ncbi:MAG: protein-glutamate O-methyltransferase CheR [Pseudomonadota bacterium]